MTKKTKEIRMNTYKRYCPNVFVAQCDAKHEKGETIIVTTKRGKKNECIIHNLVAQRDGVFFYSITRADGFDSQQYAANKVEKLNASADAADRRGNDWHAKSQEDREFLALGEPIKVGHHSEKRHRALIQRNWRRMENAVEEFQKADGFRKRVAYWDEQSKKIDLSMPESIEFFSEQLKEATAYYAGLKDGTYSKEHRYSLAYAKKRVNELVKRRDIAVILWG